MFVCILMHCPVPQSLSGLQWNRCWEVHIQNDESRLVRRHTTFIEMRSISDNSNHNRNERNWINRKQNNHHFILLERLRISNKNRSNEANDYDEIYIFIVVFTIDMIEFDFLCRIRQRVGPKKSLKGFVASTNLFRALFGFWQINSPRKIIFIRRLVPFWGSCHTAPPRALASKNPAATSTFILTCLFWAVLDLYAGTNRHLKSIVELKLITFSESNENLNILEEARISPDGKSTSETEHSHSRATLKRPRIRISNN